jgi:hypothetical protein
MKFQLWKVEKFIAMNEKELEQLILHLKKKKSKSLYICKILDKEISIMKLIKDKCLNSSIYNHKDQEFYSIKNTKKN